MSNDMGIPIWRHQTCPFINTENSMISMICACCIKLCDNKYMIRTSTKSLQILDFFGLHTNRDGRAALPSVQSAAKNPRGFPRPVKTRAFRVGFLPPRGGTPALSGADSRDESVRCPLLADCILLTPKDSLGWYIYIHIYNTFGTQFKYSRQIYHTWILWDYKRNMSHGFWWVLNGFDCAQHMWSKKVIYTQEN